MIERMQAIETRLLLPKGGKNQLSSLTTLAFAVIRNSKGTEKEKAIALLKEVLQIHTRRLERDDPDLLDALGNLAIGYCWTYQNSEAIAILEDERLRSCQKKILPGDPTRRC